MRYPIEYQVMIEKKAGDRSVNLMAKTLNISLSGVGVEIPSESNLRAGDRILISFHFSAPSNSIAEALPLEAQVIWRNDHYCGIEILEKSLEKVQYFTSLVDACEAYLYFRPENSKPKIVA